MSTFINASHAASSSPYFFGLIPNSFKGISKLSRLPLKSSGEKSVDILSKLICSFMRSCNCAMIAIMRLVWTREKFPRIWLYVIGFMIKSISLFCEKDCTNSLVLLTIAGPFFFAILQKSYILVAKICHFNVTSKFFYQKVFHLFASRCFFRSHANLL